MKFSADEKYQQPLISTLVYIQTHLGDDLPLDELARRAGFSPYHFHRVFTEFVGEPVKEHIRRLRLERGAYRLKISQDLVLQIALEAGFKTHESFTRAFARKFGVNPSHFRQDFLKAAQERQKRRGGAAQAIGAPALRGDPGLLPNGATAARTRLEHVKPHYGSFEGLADTYAHIYDAQIAPGQYQMRPLPAFEIYGSTRVKEDLTIHYTDVYLPVEPVKDQPK
jgi:AraC-like DNA-binding protein